MKIIGLILSIPTGVFLYAGWDINPIFYIGAILLTIYYIHYEVHYRNTTTNRK